MKMMKRLLRFFVALILISGLSQFSLAAGGGGGGDTPYFDLTAPFVVNINSDDGLVFLQVNAQFKVKKPEVKTHLNTHMPAIRHTMMLVLSEQTQNAVRSVAGKEKLRASTLKEVQTLLKEQIGDEAIDEIYFTGFIIQ